MIKDIFPVSKVNSTEKIGLIGLERDIKYRKFKKFSHIKFEPERVRYYSRFDSGKKFPMIVLGVTSDKKYLVKSPHFKACFTVDKRGFCLNKNKPMGMDLVSSVAV